MPSFIAISGNTPQTNIYYTTITVKDTVTGNILDLTGYSTLVLNNRTNTVSNLISTVIVDAANGNVSANITEASMNTVNTNSTTINFHLLDRSGTKQNVPFAKALLVLTRPSSVEPRSHIDYVISLGRNIFGSDGFTWNIAQHRYTQDPVISTGGGSGSGENLVYTVTQTGHGFFPGNVLYFTGTQYALANAGDGNTTGMGMVSTVLSPDKFNLVISGTVYGLSGFNPGDYYFVTVDSPGQLINVEPTNGYSNPLFLARSATDGIILQYRPGLIETAANAASSGVGPAFDQANLALTIANLAFDEANTDHTIANLAYDKANSAYNVAQAAFAQANSSGSNALYIANLAFNTANAAFGQANTDLTIANLAFNTANAAYGQANTDLTIANLAFDKANSANVLAFNASANAAAAFAQANTDLYIANLAFDKANTSKPAENVSISVNQTGHGFVVGNVITFTNGAYALANAANGNTLGIGIISVVPNANYFTFVEAGTIYGLSGLSQGQYYYTAVNAAGQLTTVEPTAGYSNPLMLATTTNNAIVFPYRPSLVSLQNNNLSPTGNANWIFLNSAGIATAATVKNSGITMSLISPSNGTYYLTMYAPRSGQISLANAKTDVGTCTANVQINGVPVTNLSAFAVTSTASSNNATGANTINVGDVVSINVTSVASSPTQLNITLVIIPT